MLILSGLIFLTVFLAIAGGYLWLRPNRTLQRLQDMTGSAPSSSSWQQSFVKLVGPFAKLTSPEGEWEDSPLRLRFIRAGVRHPDARLLYFAAKALLPFVFGLTAFVALRALAQSSDIVVLLFYVMVVALIGMYLPNFVLWLAIRGRQRELFENFPDAADLMLVCIEAGLGMDAAMTKVAEEMRRTSIPLAEELHLTNLEMRAGGTREKALRNLALRAGLEEMGTFATMLTQADKFGTSVGDSMRVFSDDLRHKRRMRAEEAAAKIPTKMLFPLVLFIFPSIIMVVLGPAIIAIVRQMAPMLNMGG